MEGAMYDLDELLEAEETGRWTVGDTLKQELAQAWLKQERKELIDQTYRLGDELNVEKLRRVKAESERDRAYAVIEAMAWDSLAHEQGQERDAKRPPMPWKQDRETMLFCDAHGDLWRIVPTGLASDPINITIVQREYLPPVGDELERDMNAKLTEQLEQAEAERDALLANPAMSLPQCKTCEAKLLWFKWRSHAQQDGGR